jgi:hypothetical protein
MEILELADYIGSTGTDPKLCSKIW